MISGPEFAYVTAADGTVVVAGFRVTRDGERFAAQLSRPLTETEREYGCLASLIAGSSWEMLTLISAQAILRDQVARALPAPVRS